jgi:hypothetical protein
MSFRVPRLAEPQALVLGLVDVPAWSWHQDRVASSCQQPAVANRRVFLPECRAPQVRVPFFPRNSAPPPKPSGSRYMPPAPLIRYF